MLAMVTVAGLIVNEAKVPVMVKFLSAAAALFSAVVKSKETLPVREPCGMVIV